MEQGTFRDRISVNKRNSVLLIAGFLAFVAVFGYIIGYAWIRPRHLLRR
jgi:heat shock protein HtpX